MPYNTTAIPPRTQADVTGQALLPLSRVKKIIASDPEIAACSNNAAFIMTVAAEMFVQYVAREAAAHARADTKKARRNVQYRDVAAAVAHDEKLEFLEDVVPRTVPFKEVRELAAVTRSRLGGEKVVGVGVGNALDPYGGRAHSPAAGDGDGVGAADTSLSRRRGQQKLPYTAASGNYSSPAGLAGLLDDNSTNSAAAVPATATATAAPPVPAGDGSSARDINSSHRGAVAEYGEIVAPQPRTPFFLPTIVAGADRTDHMSPEISSDMLPHRGTGYYGRGSGPQPGNNNPGSAYGAYERDNEGDVEMY